MIPHKLHRSWLRVISQRLRDITAVHSEGAGANHDPDANRLRARCVQGSRAQPYNTFETHGQCAIKLEIEREQSSTFVSEPKISRLYRDGQFVCRPAKVVASVSASHWFVSSEMPGIKGRVAQLSPSTPGPSASLARCVLYCDLKAGGLCHLVLICSLRELSREMPRSAMQPCGPSALRYYIFTVLLRRSCHAQKTTRIVHIPDLCRTTLCGIEAPSCHEQHRSGKAKHCLLQS